jgi:hypothetical protein
MRFRIKPADTFIWNLSELVDFLIANQNQAIIIENGNEGCCAATVGLYQWIDKFKFASVVIETSNCLEKHDRYTVKHCMPWHFLNVKQPIEPELHTWNKTAIFGTVYGRPLWHRLGLASHLLAHHSTTSRVGFATDPGNVDKRELFELIQLWQYSPSSFIDFANIQTQYPQFHPEIEEYTPGATLTDGYVAQSKRIYPNFLIDVVAETFTSGNCFFVTEKTVRPMLLKKPFIVFGSCNYLLYLRQLGFKTFGELWDEDYDGYAEANRYQRIVDLIDNLATRSTSELEDMYQRMQHILDYNYDLLIHQTFNTTIIKI